MTDLSAFLALCFMLWFFSLLAAVLKNNWFNRGRSIGPIGLIAALWRGDFK